MRIDINCDLGEGGEHDEAILEYVTSANIACGFHAGDPATMRRTVEFAVKKGVCLGAHPGIRDPAGFGRRPVPLAPQEAFDLTLYQIGALRAFAMLQGGRLVHVKPHGALYHLAARDAAVADALAKAVRSADPKLILIGQAGSEMIRAARREGLQAAEEAFADRGYRADGTLVPRGQLGALISDPALAALRAVRLAKEGKVQTVDGTELSIRPDTICLHGDTPGAPQLARTVREALLSTGLEIRGLGIK